jgi:hypothetical protein
MVLAYHPELIDFDSGRFGRMLKDRGHKPIETFRKAVQDEFDESWQQGLERGERATVERLGWGDTRDLGDDDQSLAEDIDDTRTDYITFTTTLRQILRTDVDQDVIAQEFERIQADITNMAREVSFLVRKAMLLVGEFLYSGFFAISSGKRFIGRYSCSFLVVLCSKPILESLI